MDALLQSMWSMATLVELTNSHLGLMRPACSSLARLQCCTKGSQHRNVLQSPSLPEVKGCKNHFASSFAVRLCFPLLNTYVPASQLSMMGQPKLAGCSANSTEGSSSQLPLAATARECLLGWLVADLCRTGSECAFHAFVYN